MFTLSYFSTKSTTHVHLSVPCLIFEMLFLYQPDTLSYSRFLKITLSMESWYTEKIQSTEQHTPKKKKENQTTSSNILKKKRNYQKCLYLEL